MEYFVGGGAAPALAEAEALALWRRACGEGGVVARRRLAENFAPVIDAEAARIAGDGAGAERAAVFVPWGNLGLLRAFCSYRPDSPVGFYEYCRRRVCETMMDEARAGGLSAVRARGIDCPAEVARLWGELSREFSVAFQLGAG